MKKIMRIIALFVIAAELAGCGSMPTKLERKFTRKKKEPVHRPAAIYIEEGAYQKKFSNDYYYKTHYTMWRSWHSELVDQFGDNHKKTERCAQEAYSHLRQMGQYLNEAKREELEPLIESLSGIVRRIEGGRYSQSEEPGLR